MDSVRQQSSGKVVTLTLVRACLVLFTFFLGLRFARYTLARPMLISDDEGYLLLTFKHYFEGEHLYSQVFAQYGPFYFLIQKAIFRMLHLPVTYDAGRLVFCGCWVLASCLGGIFVYRVSKNVTLASAAALAVLWLERVMAFEPNHPEQMVVVLLMASCVVAVKPTRMSLLLLGAFGAALAFTKINVGFFSLLAALIAAVCVLPDGRLRNAGKLLVIGMAAGPIVLMHHFLDTWAQGFCMLSILTGVSVVLAGLHAKVFSAEGMTALRYMAAGALAAAILILFETTVEGLSLSTLLYGVILQPLHQPEFFFIALTVGKKMVLLACVLSVCVAALYWAPEHVRHADWLGALKCVAGISLIALLVKREVLNSGSRSFGFTILYVLLPLVLLPGKNGRWGASDFFPRIFVTALAATQFLQAYPVAGSQVNVGAAPFLLWAFVCVYDGAGSLLELLRSSKRWPVPVNAESIVGALILIGVVIEVNRTGRLHSNYPFPPSSLPGSSSLHLPPDLEATFETLSKDVRTNCGVLFTMPGMGGFNLWSGVATPDGFNYDAWMRGLPLNEQQQTLQRLESNPSACVIVQPASLSVWGVPNGGIETLPLARYILEDMPVVFRTGGKWGYEIRVSPNRPVPWFEQALAPGG